LSISQQDKKQAQELKDIPTGEISIIL